MLIYEIGAEGRTGVTEEKFQLSACVRALLDYPKYRSYKSFDILLICRRKTFRLTVNFTRSAPAR